MADTLIKKKIEYDLRPAYYDDFKCLAQDCQISCCKGWSITFNRKDYLTLRRQRGSEELNQRMSKSLSRITNDKLNFYAEFALNGDTCPLLAEDGLCALQKECGHEVLPVVCKTYPRKQNANTSGYYERALSPSCEAVLELLWNLPQGIDFVSDPLPQAEQSTIMLPLPEKNPTFLAAYYQEIRSLCIDILQDRRFSMAQRILLMGIFLQKLTAEEDVDIQQWLENTMATLAHPDAAKIAAKLTQENEKNTRFALFNHLKTVILMATSERAVFSSEMIQKIRNELLLNRTVLPEEKKLRVDTDLEKFLKIRADFLADFGENEYFLENFAVTVFFYMGFPYIASKEKLWQSYVSFCNIYSFSRFMAICSYLEPAESKQERKAALFRGLIFTSRSLLHSQEREQHLQQELFDNENATLAHMQTLLSI